MINSLLWLIAFCYNQQMQRIKLPVVSLFLILLKKSHKEEQLSLWEQGK